LELDPTTKAMTSSSRAVRLNAPRATCRTRNLPVDNRWPQGLPSLRARGSVDDLAGTYSVKRDLESPTLESAPSSASSATLQFASSATEFAPSTMQQGTLLLTPTNSPLPTMSTLLQADIDEIMNAVVTHTDVVNVLCGPQGPQGPQGAQTAGTPNNGALIDTRLLRSEFGTLGRSSATLGELGQRVRGLARDAGGLGRGC
jgi:hypothetical protein